MSRALRLAPLALAVVLVLAGCGGVLTDSPSTDDATETSTPMPSATVGGETTAVTTTAADTVAVRNGSLPVDEDRAFTRVQSLLGTDVEPRPVEIRNLSEWRNSVTALGVSPLNRALGYENVSVDRSQPTGATRPSGYVYVHLADGSPAEIERVLVHEYAHMIQFRTAMLPWLDRLQQPRLTIDRIKTRLALTEGGAVYVTDAYVDRHLDVPRNSEQIERLYRTESDSHRITLSHYHFGSRYVASRIDDPSNLQRVYEDHPRTTEQIIHNYSRSEEPPLALPVSTNATGSDWRYVGNNTLGEMVTRVTFRTAMERERAATAATGWGDDELTVFQHRQNRSRFGWAWVQRWDTVDDADEATAALDTYASTRDAESHLAFRTRRLNETTTVLVFGDDAFVTNASVAQTDETVTVRAAS